jgi:hypothetical protein
VAKVNEPRFQVERRDAEFEVRRYGARVAAETVVADRDFDAAGSEGFRRLAGYIFGKNQAKSKIAMTAPVAQSGTPGESRELSMTAPVAQRAEGLESARTWTVAFMMPDGETLATLPQPIDARVTLRELPPVRVAVVRFSGRWTDANMREHEATLRAWTAKQSLEVMGNAEVNRYDPPWKPWFWRRNEIWLTLAEPPAAALNDAQP